MLAALYRLISPPVLHLKLTRAIEEKINKPKTERKLSPIALLELKSKQNNMADIMQKANYVRWELPVMYVSQVNQPGEINYKLAMARGEIAFGNILLSIKKEDDVKFDNEIEGKGYPLYINVEVVTHMNSEQVRQLHDHMEELRPDLFA